MVRNVAEERGRAFKKRAVESIRPAPRSRGGHGFNSHPYPPPSLPVQVPTIRTAFWMGEGFIRARSCELRGRSNLHFRVARQRHLVVDQ